MPRRNRIVTRNYDVARATPEDVIEIKKANREKLDWILQQPLEWLIERARAEYGSNWMCIFAGEEHYLHEVRHQVKYQNKRGGLQHPMKANRSRKIQKIDYKTNELVETYENAQDCQDKQGLSKSQISTVLSVCTKKMLQYKGYIYKFEDEEEYLNQLKNYDYE